MTVDQQIAQDLTLRTLRDANDKAHFASFNARYNGPEEGASCACLLDHHPDMTLDDFWIIESDVNQEIVSTTCLIPWSLRFCGLDLRAAQLEMVLTHPKYRRRGLVRAQITEFERIVADSGYDLSVIWGIPYYYRQYGYGYAIDGATVESLPVWKIPRRSEETPSPIRLRPAQSADVPFLTESYHGANCNLDLCTRREPDYWRYLLEAAHHPFEIVERTQTGEPVGYAMIVRSATQISILESGLPDAMTALALLQLLGAQVSEQIQVSWPSELPLAKIARQLGSQTVRGGQWLIRIPNMTRFLVKLQPLLDKRVSDSAWRAVTATITINLYREAFQLRFAGGKITGVDSLGFVDSSMGADGGDLCIPPEAFLRLLFGYREVDELFDAWPDIVVKAQIRGLVDTLFPRLRPFLYTPFHSYGAMT